MIHINLTADKSLLERCKNQFNINIMAILRSGILDGFSGKVGSVVGSIWKGICTIRMYVANPTNPNSPAQLEQRAKFATVMKFLQPLTSFFRVGFKNLAIGQTAVNAAFSANFPDLITGVFPNFSIDYSKAVVSKGNLAGALNPTVTATLAGQIHYTWEDNSWETNGDASDQAMLVVYNPIKQAVVAIVNGPARSTMTMSVILPNSYAGDEVQCYIAFINQSGTKVSNSEYVLGLIVL